MDCDTCANVNVIAFADVAADAVVVDAFARITAGASVVDVAVVFGIVTVLLGDASPIAGWSVNRLEPDLKVVEQYQEIMIHRF